MMEQDLYTLAGGRKERVLHARIPPALDQALKQQARRLHVPVSRLIRDLLADAISREIQFEAQGPVAWQSLVLSGDTSCQSCAKALTVGDEAFLAVYGRSSVPKINCADCKTRTSV